jgi:hypothetical protein
MRVSLPILLCCAVLAASCAASPWEQADDARRPEALLDAYLIAHGMAASYAQSAEAKPAVVLQLRDLDMKAAQSFRDLTRASTANVAATAEAVAALTDYAAHQAQQPQ